MVKPRYKQTEIGLIPEEWACREIGSFADVCMCKRIFAEQTSEMGEIPFYKIGTFGKKADAYISRALFEEYRRNYSYPQKGDVLISAAGTLGRTVVYDGEEAYFQDSNIVWLDIDKSQISNDYLYHYYKVIKWTPAEGSTIARLYNGIINSTNVAVPPKPEQKAISEALSDIDSLIVNLKKLITKKKAIKQGAMQELLTGNRRLQGYTEKWDKVKLGECCGFLSGGTPSKANHEWWNGTIPWISSSDISANDVNRIPISRFISQEALDHSATKLCPVHSVLIVSRVGVGKVAVNCCELCTSQDFTTLVPRLHDAHYLAYCLLPIMQEKASQAQGTSIKGITTDDIAEIEVFLPEKDEQKAIASVLSDMDMDVQRLEQKLLKYCSVRQGMMNELLTGRIRLIDKEDA